MDSTETQEVSATEVASVDSILPVIGDPILPVTDPEPEPEAEPQAQPGSYVAPVNPGIDIRTPHFHIKNPA